MFGTFAYVLLALGAADMSLEACDDRASECRETCTMEFGTDVNLRLKLGQCLLECKTQQKQCRMDVASTVKLPDAGMLDLGPLDTGTARKSTSPRK